MDDQPRSKAMHRAVIFGGIQGVAWIAVCIVLLTFVPKYERIFRDFKLELPPLTISVLMMSHFMFDYWFIAIPLAMLLGASNFGIVYALESSQSVVGSRIWRILASIAVLVAAAFVILSVVLPLRHLIDSLNAH